MQRHILLITVIVLLQLLLLPLTLTVAHPASSSSNEVAFASHPVTNSATASSSTSSYCMHGGELLTRQTIASKDAASKAGEGSAQQAIKASPFECACVQGYAGERCEYHDFCTLHNPCSSNGACLNTRDGMLCRCQPGWIGRQCDQPATCSAESCGAHGECVVEEVMMERVREEPLTTTATAAKHQHSAIKTIVNHTHHHHKASESSSSSSSSSSQPPLPFHLLRGTTTSSCVCAPGWSGEQCSIRHADLCAQIPPCTVFSLPHDPSTNVNGTLVNKPCGCAAAMLAKCSWCLELGVAFAKPEKGEKAASDSTEPDISSACLAPVHDEMAHCPSPSAQAVHSCTLMDGTSFGWCAVGSAIPAATASATGTVTTRYGYATAGNPSAPSAGQKRCHHWVWSSSGCGHDWTTGAVSKHPTPPTGGECDNIPRCDDTVTAGARLCGCQAALTIGCNWALVEQIAFVPGRNTSVILAIAESAPQCPSQQAQTVKSCEGVGGLARFGWCSVTDTSTSTNVDGSPSLSLGYTTDGTPHGPTNNPKQCAAWTYDSSACPTPIDRPDYDQDDSLGDDGDDELDIDEVYEEEEAGRGGMVAVSFTTLIDTNESQALPSSRAPSSSEPFRAVDIIILSLVALPLLVAILYHYNVFRYCWKRNDYEELPMRVAEF